MLGAYVQGKDHVDRNTLMTATREVSGKKDRQWIIKTAHPALWAFVIVLFFAALTAGYYNWGTQSDLISRPRAISQKQIVATPIQEPPSADLVKPVGGTRAGTRDLAYQALFDQWGIPVNPQNRRSPCEQALEKGLQCLNEKGGLSDLQRLNKPAVLALVDEKGDEYFAAILSIQDQTATFTLGNETRKVNINKIASWWLGEYTLFWKAPSNYKGKLGEGNHGPLVAWIDQQLSIVQGRAVKPDEKQTYDESMKKEIRAFQITAGLVPDGIMGPKTIICLANASNSGGPTLINKKREH